MSTTHTRTHTSVTLANPHLVCDLCQQTVTAWHDPAKCGCSGDAYNLPCEHRAGVTSTCPSWSPVDRCQCVGLGAHDATAPPEKPAGYWDTFIDRYFDRELGPASGGDR